MLSVVLQNSFAVIPQPAAIRIIQEDSISPSFGFGWLAQIFMLKLQ
jgi:hypothetical protein